MSDVDDSVQRQLGEALSRANVQRVQAMVVATKGDLTRVFERHFPDRGPLHSPYAAEAAKDYKAQADLSTAEAAVEAFTLWSDGFEVEFRVAIEYRAFLPRISAVASFKDTMRWEIDAVRVFWGDEVRIEFDHWTLGVKLHEASRFCEYFS